MIAQAIPLFMILFDLYPKTCFVAAMIALQYCCAIELS